MMHANVLASDRASSESRLSRSSSIRSADLAKEMTEEECAVLADAGGSYDVDLSRAYALKLKGALCFVAMKVPTPLPRLDINDAFSYITHHYTYKARPLGRDHVPIYRP